MNRPLRPSNTGDIFVQLSGNNVPLQVKIAYCANYYLLVQQIFMMQKVDVAFTFRLDFQPFSESGLQSSGGTRVHKTAGDRAYFTFCNMKKQENVASIAKPLFEESYLW